MSNITPLLWRRGLAKCMAVLLLVCALMPWLSSASAAGVISSEDSPIVHCSPSEGDLSQPHCGSSTVCEAEPVTSEMPGCPDFLVAWLHCLSTEQSSARALVFSAQDNKTDPPSLWPQRVHAHVERWLI